MQQPGVLQRRGMVARPSSASDLADQLAHAVSIVGSPPLLALPTALLAGNVSPGFAVTWPGVLVLLLASALLPSLFVYVAYRLGVVRDFDLSSRTERVVPAAFGALCTAIAYPALVWLEAPPLIRAVGAGLAVQLALLAVVTLYWKISYHAAVAAALALLALVLYGPALAVPLAALAWLVGWARIRRGRHTAAQVAFGYLSAATLLWWTWPA